MLHVAQFVSFALVSLQEPAPVLPSTIRSVDVYPSTALVVRTGELPAGDGRFVVEGLPSSLVRNSLRLRAPGAEVVTLELRERRVQATPVVAVERTQTRLDEVRDGIRLLRDELKVRASSERHFNLLLDESAKFDPANPGSIEQRQQLFEYARDQLRVIADECREFDAKLKELDAERVRLELDLARWQNGETTLQIDVHVDVLDTDGDADAFELEYQVNGARWEPYYDIRAAADLASVELVHRARIHQETGEDWSGVQLALSTSRPRQGLAAPEAQIQWVSLWERVVSGGVMAPAQDMAQFERGGSPFESLVDAEDTKISEEAQRAFTGLWASILADGVNLRYALPRAQDVPNRPEPTAVLIGREALDVAIERVALPGIDPTVWLRGRAKNSTPWVLLEGEAGVHVGSNYLGTTQLARVALGADFDVPLGEDPNVTIERIQTEDTKEQPGIFGSKVRAYESYRLNVTNASQGKIKLVLHESLPRAQDERIEIAIDKVSPALSTAERWKKLAEERGLVTWELDLAAGEKRTVDLRLSFAYPQKAQLSR
jgi:uncharacterized protein (TIGR02231 family)